MTQFCVSRQFADPVRARIMPEQPPAFSRPGLRGPSPDVFRAAAAEPSRALDPPVRERLARAFPGDFAQVRVHSGEASRAAAASVGARAYTLGRDIHLGAEAAGLSGQERAALLAHEAAHAVQQGMRQVQPSAGLPVGRPGDPAEREAERAGQAVTAPATYPQAQLPASVSPCIQRDLTGKKTVHDGTFDLNLKTESHPGALSGMRGTIEFTPSENTPDSDNIRLLQVVRAQDLTTKKEVAWTGDEARRNTMQTAAKGVEPGYFVDHSAAKAKPREHTKDPSVSPYYRDYWPNPTVSHDGSKNGKTTKSASLGDFPRSNGERRFSFETAAKAADIGYHYATLTWGFTISDAAKGTVDHEYADAHQVPSDTFYAAVAAFNKAYRNPRSPTAPTE